MTVPANRTDAFEAVVMQFAGPDERQAFGLKHGFVPPLYPSLSKSAPFLASIVRSWPTQSPPGHVTVVVAVNSPQTALFLGYLWGKLEHEAPENEPRS